jgi:hypothetical protein
MTNQEMEALKQSLKADLHEELRDRNGIGLLSKVAIWAGLMVSVINAGTLLWKGGEVSEQLRRTVADQSSMCIEVQAMKVSATGGAKEYMARTDEWKSGMDKRVTRMEDIALGIPNMAADIQVIKTLLSEHIKKETK